MDRWRRSWCRRLCGSATRAPFQRCCELPTECNGNCFQSCLPKLLQRCCLRPQYSLRTQLIAGYGTTAFVTILWVVILAILAGHRAGSQVKDESIDLFQTQLDAILQETGILTGDILDKKISGLKGSTTLLAEIVKDRIVGYPHFKEWETDKLVPFWDRDSQTNMYPLKIDLLPRDWMIESNLDLNENNMDKLGENVQERANMEGFLPYMEGWNTETAIFMFQGNCDPKQTDPAQKSYYPFCRDSHNDAQLGGILNPTSTLALLEQKAADLSVYLKAIFEAEPSAMTVYVIFANSGAGASLIYPSFTFDFKAEYISEGCEWMKQINPLTGNPYAKEEDIHRCTPNGFRVNGREFNGLERAWCRDQALHPGESRVYGPYADATRDSWRLTIGNAVFDRLTGEFIACTAIDVSLVQAEKLLAEVNENVASDMVVTRPDGTLVVGSFSTDDTTSSNLTPYLWETEFIDKETYQKLTDNLAFWEGEWDIESARERYEYSVKTNGNYYSVFPSPIPPDEYDPYYKPEFLIFASIESQVQDNALAAIEESIENDIEELILITVALGAIGLCSLMSVVSIVARVLTQPLEWMESKAWEIVHHADERVGNSLTENKLSDDSSNNIFRYFSFIPRTEVQELVSEFRSMISGFSGEGASRVAIPRQTETKNMVSWKDEFREFYEVNPTTEHNLGEDMRKMTRSVSRRMSNQGRDRSMTMPTKDIAEFARIMESSMDFSVEDEKPSDSKQLKGEQTAERKSPARVSLLSSMRSGGPERMIMLKDDSSSQFMTPSMRINRGSNIRRSGIERRSQLSYSSKSTTPVSFEDSTLFRSDDIPMWKSPLFWNLLFWIVLPLLAAIIAILVIVGTNILETFTERIEQANQTSYMIEQEHFESSVNLTVKHIEQIYVRPLFDLHIITRMAGWLLFGAINRSSSFTNVEMEMVDDCKFYEDTQQCPFHSNNTRSPCDCQWNDPWKQTCQPVGETSFPTSLDPRYVQRLYYVNQRRKANETYPEFYHSPESTSWFTDPKEMIGFEKGSNAEGYLTNYDRLRVTSALSSVIIPLYNYGANLRADKSDSAVFSGFIAFEAAGEYFGYSGCKYSFANYAHFQSSETNNASAIRGDLCPLGKFGYDPRCRRWYDVTKQRALSVDDAVYITPPYQFATIDIVGLTAVSPLIDPKTGDFVGTTLTDFSIEAISEIVEESEIEFYAVIMPNATGGKNVVASSNTKGMASTPESIFELFMPYDSSQSIYGAHFASVIDDMENEKTGHGCDLYRTNENGEVQQYCYYYEPIYNTELKPVQPDDFRRGAEVRNEFVYSIIMFQESQSFSSAFLERKDSIDQVLMRNAIIYIMLTTLAMSICIIVTAMISFYVTRPMIQLLQTVKQVNDGGIEDDMPPLTGGSREVHQVYTSFAKLYKIVRVSNSAFFVGDLKLAHHIALDALRLFQKIGDKKAIAIAHNNMANTLLAWIVEHREPGRCCMLNDDGSRSNENCCARAAINHYTESIVAGTMDFEQAFEDSEKSLYAQQLADRHFNRAMCLLHTRSDPCSPADAKETALDDLFLARQFDQGVKEYMLHSRTLLKYSDVIFERSLRRLHGLATLIATEPEVWNVWDVYDLVDQTDLMLQAAWNQEDAPLFRNVNNTGRLQELEAAATGIELSCGKGNDAILLATRMLVEDEFLLDAAFLDAADCFLQYSRDKGACDIDGDSQSSMGSSISSICYNEQQDGNEYDESKGDTSKDPALHYPRDFRWSGSLMTKLRQEFKRMRKPGTQAALDIGRSFVFCIELQGVWNGRSALTKLQEACISFYDTNCQPGDYVGIVTFDPMSGILRHLAPSQRIDSENEHKQGLINATQGVACSRFVPALMGAMSMAIELENSTASDVCLLYVSDGGAFDTKVFQRLQRKLKGRSEHHRYSTNASDSSLSSASHSSASSIDLIILDLSSKNSESSESHQHDNSLTSGPTVTQPQFRSLFADSCKNLALATKSRASRYIPGDRRNPKDAFVQASEAIHSGTSFAGMQLQQALTMQKF